MSVPHVREILINPKSDVLKAVTALVDAAQHMQEDPANMERVESLIVKLKHLLHEERHEYATLTHQSSEKRKKMESMHNLIQFLELQVQRARRAAQRRGLNYYLASISNTVLGNEVGRIGKSMESKLQSWLDQQGIRELANVINNGTEEEKLEALISFENVVQRGFDSLLQDTILSTGLVEKLSTLLEPGATSWDVQKAAAFVLSALVDFNKDIFVSLVLMAKVVERILKLMDMQPDEHVLILVCVLKSLLSAGQTIIVDEIYAQNGVCKLVGLLDHKSSAVQHVGIDCVFEMVYYGRVEVVEKMFKLEVVRKLASLQQLSLARVGNIGSVDDCANHAHQQERSVDCGGSNGHAGPVLDQDGSSDVAHLFSGAVTRFALHLAIGSGLRKRERRALKLEFLKQIKEVMSDDAEVATITAEVLWAP